MSPVDSRWRFMLAGAWIAYLFLVGFIVLGFVLHTSREPQILGYSYGDLAMVVAISAVLLGPPALLHLLIARLGIRHAVLALIPVVTLGLVAWFALATRYYLKQSHPFEPFLQAPGHPVPDVERTDEFRVLALGGSTTEGGRLPMEERYPSLLAEELRTRLGPSVEVHNAGRVWWTTKHSLINYVTDGRRWDADVVVVMHGINDLYRSCSPEAFVIGDYNSRWSHFYGPAITGARPPTFVGSLFAPILPVLDRNWYDAQRFREVDLPLQHYQSLPDFERHVRALVRYIRSDGAQPVLMTQPSLLRAGLSEEEQSKLNFGRVFCARRLSAWNIEVPSPESLGKALDAYNDVTRKVAREESVTLIDLAAVVPRTGEYFTDDVHHTPRATGLISREVADVLVPLLAPPDANSETDSAPVSQP